MNAVVQPKRTRRVRVRTNGGENARPRIDLRAVYGLAEVATLLGTSAEHAGQLLGRGDIRGRRIGRRWVVIGAAVADWLARGDAPPTTLGIAEEPDDGD